MKSFGDIMINHDYELPVARIEVNADGEIIGINKRAERIIFKRKEQVVGKKIWYALAQTINSFLQRELKLLHHEQRECLTESFFPAFNRWYQVIIQPLEQSIYLYYFDITAKKAEEKEKNLRQTAFGHHPLSAAILVFPFCEIADVNDAWLEMTAYKKEELVGHCLDDIGILESYQEGRTISLKGLAFENAAIREQAILWCDNTGKRNPGILDVEPFVCDNRRYFLVVLRSKP